MTSFTHRVELGHDHEDDGERLGLAIGDLNADT